MIMLFPLLSTIDDTEIKSVNTDDNNANIFSNSHDVKNSSEDIN